MYQFYQKWLLVVLNISMWHARCCPSMWHARCCPSMWHARCCPSMWHARCCPGTNCNINVSWEGKMPFTSSKLATAWQLCVKILYRISWKSDRPFTNWYYVTDGRTLASHQALLFGTCRRPDKKYQGSQCCRTAGSVRLHSCVLC